MQVEKLELKPMTEKRIPLKDLKPGDVFRFTGFTYEEALFNEGAAFYIVIKPQPQKPNKVTAVSVDGQLVIEKDDDHFVHHHTAKLLIGQAHMQP